MQAVLNFPDISPEIFSFTVGTFTFALRWYALAYIVGILIGWRMVVWLVRKPGLWPGDTAPMTPEQVERLLTWIILGVVVGGRLGYVLFYWPADDPLTLGKALRIWEGGMAFHGGLLGVVVAIVTFSLTQKLPVLSVGDAAAVATTPGLFLGRLANFVNGELWGRPSDAPWAVIFPGPYAQDCPGPAGLVERGGEVLCARHPSQLYEAGLEGLLLGAILLFLIFGLRWLKHRGAVFGTFLVGYGTARVIVELFRQADPQFIAPGNPWGHVVRLGEVGLTQGQLLSLPMIAAGLILVAHGFLGRAR
ncbi:prolipoprotein diacylglyceryl transferase [Rhodobacterales bacterium HKCCE2091]|nr:prolipoprotein diacylglyceryl transferase [Rhodobacterales bacterium HKCCE2091]